MPQLPSRPRSSATLIEDGTLCVRTSLPFRLRKPSSANPVAMPALTTTPCPQRTSTAPNQTQKPRLSIKLSSAAAPSPAFDNAVVTLSQRWHNGHIFIWTRRYIEHHGRARLYNDALCSWRRFAVFALRAYMQRKMGGERNDVVEALKVIDGTKYFVGAVRAALCDEMSRNDRSQLEGLWRRLRLSRVWNEEELETLKALNCL